MRQKSQIEDAGESNARPKLRVVYPFTGRNSNELRLKLGDVLTCRRAIDDNWTEGVTHIGEIGIFPTSYVRPIEEVTEDVSRDPERCDHKLFCVQFLFGEDCEEPAAHFYRNLDVQFEQQQQQQQHYHNLPAPDRPKTPKLPGVTFAGESKHEGPFPAFERYGRCIDRELTLFQAVRQSRRSRGA